MQQEIEPGETHREPARRETAQGDALMQLATMENHLAVLRQELEARKRASDESTPGIQSPDQQALDQAKAELELREDELKRQSEELDRRSQALNEREAQLLALECALRQREEELSKMIAAESIPSQTSQTLAAGSNEARGATQSESVDENRKNADLGKSLDDSEEEAPDYSAYLDKMLRNREKPSPATEIVTRGENVDSANAKVSNEERAESPVVKENEPQKPKTGSPVDLASILRKQGFNVEEDEESATDTGKPAGREASKAKRPMPMLDDGAGSASGKDAQRSDGTKSGGEEETIDDYMSKLLARVRGGDAPAAPVVPAGPGQSSGPTPSAKKASQKAAAMAADKAAKAALMPEPKPMMLQGELAPRTVAPEKNINITAIRELANLSASSALSSHQLKTTAVNSQAKLLVTAVSLALGVTLLVFSRLPNGSPYAIYFALASFSVSMIWGVQFAKLFSQQLVARSARFERHVKRTNESTGQATAETSVVNEAALKNPAASL